MKTPDKAAVIELLERMGTVMRRRGDVHRARAYLGAANALERRSDFEELYAAGRLQEVPGVGPAIEKKVVDFVERGATPEWLEDESLAPKPKKGKGGAITRAREKARGAAGAAEWPDVPVAWETAPFRDCPDLHVHTTWSDGTLTLEEVVRWAKELQVPAVGVTDHSGSLRIARGLRPEEVRSQWLAMDRVQEKHPEVRILRGTECDILRDGRLDHPEDLLEELDYVVASLHSQLKLDKDEQTKRVLRALDNPFVTVLGHPTTRVPGHRPRANLDLDRVFRKAADRGVAMEVNGNPGRLDLDVDLARQALEAGCKLSLSSDGHSAWEMLSLAVARQMAHEAGATKRDIVNYAVLARAQKRRRAATKRPQAVDRR
ncbi:MAG TPA: PHP domain-containing protein [Candidatus Thermoplasmatota archaeon]|nr:PHP domain-containing protein [Candidatus Thermoplasmatota archaeon]